MHSRKIPLLQSEGGRAPKRHLDLQTRSNPRWWPSAAAISEGWTEKYSTRGLRKFWATCQHFLSGSLACFMLILWQFLLNRQISISSLPQCLWMVLIWYKVKNIKPQSQRKKGFYATSLIVKNTFEIRIFLDLCCPNWRKVRKGSDGTPSPRLDRSRRQSL